MNRYAWLITSAVNTKFGIYNAAQRLQQTLNTIASIKHRVPTAKIFLLEMSAIKLTDSQRDSLTAVVDNIIDFTSDPSVVGLYHCTENWDVVKNVTEVMCFSKALQHLHSDTNQFSDIQRIFKISGRYELTDNFDIAYYDQYKLQSQIIVNSSRPSQFPYTTTLVERQFMSRLWSWPTVLTTEIINVYDRGLVYMGERLAASGYVDIEHMLYKFLDHAKITEQPIIGIRGNIGPTGTIVAE